MTITEDNKITIIKQVEETIDLIQLDTEIAHLKDTINQIQLEVDKKQVLRNSITQTFPEIEDRVYQLVEGEYTK